MRLDRVLPIHVSCLFKNGYLNHEFMVILGRFLSSESLLEILHLSPGELVAIKDSYTRLVYISMSKEQCFLSLHLQKAIYSGLRLTLVYFGLQ